MCPGLLTPNLSPALSFIIANALLARPSFAAGRRHCTDQAANLLAKGEAFDIYSFTTSLISRTWGLILRRVPRCMLDFSCAASQHTYMQLAAIQRGAAALGFVLRRTGAFIARRLLPRC